MDKSFLAAYVSLLIKTCHLRRAHAIGGMAAYIPVKNNEEANRIAFEKVRQDKLREVTAGHDGTWVAHPGLVPLAKQVFDEHMQELNQIYSKKQSEVSIGQNELLDLPKGKITMDGLNTNINVGVQYLAAWLCGRGAVPINNLMGDAATAEICRAQIWQWIHHRSRLDSDEIVTLELFQSNLEKALNQIKKEIGEVSYTASRLDLAAKLFREEVSAQEFPEFLTLPAYEVLLKLKED